MQKISLMFARKTKGVLVLLLFLLLLIINILVFNEKNVKTDCISLTSNATSLNLSFSTYLGGSGWDRGDKIAVTLDGSSYVVGTCSSNDFPTLNAYNNTFGGYYDVFVTKFSKDGSLLWSTYLGGCRFDYSLGIAVSSDGSCYVTGETYSYNFPTLNAYDNIFNGGYGYCDAFVTKYATNGTILWSTFLG